MSIDLVGMSTKSWSWILFSCVKSENQEGESQETFATTFNPYICFAVNP